MVLELLGRFRSRWGKWPAKQSDCCDSVVAWCYIQELYAGINLKNIILYHFGFIRAANLPTTQIIDLSALTRRVASSITIMVT